MRTQRGFTLVEILVASAIAAILATMAFGAMNQAVQNRERVREAQARLVAMQFTVRSLVQDFSQLVPRPVRVPVGEGYESALQSDLGGVPGVVLTRAGWGNPAGIQRSSLQRVRYQLRDGTLYREYWTVLDAQAEPQPVERALLDRVVNFSVRYMSDRRQWRDDWPPAQENTEGAPTTQRWRPLAVQVTIELADWGTITRLIEVAG